MRRLIFVAGLLVLSMKGIAQAPDPSLQLPDSIVQADPELVDLDNDGLLDVFLVMKSKSNKSYVGIIQGDTIIQGDAGGPLSKMETIFPIISSQAYLIADYDHDNAMDIIVSGKKDNSPLTAIYQ